MSKQNICIRVNLGGQEYQDKEGKIWYADKEYIEGSWGCLNLPETDVLTTFDPISNTKDPQLFQSMRMGEKILYRFDLPDGDYKIKLLFAEIYWETSAAEQQNVYIQGRRVLKNFNIFDEAGHDKALEKSFRTKVNQGYLEIKFVGYSLPMHSGARACAIEVQSI
ncbi:malectin [Candidatus Aerophobetes bacterium]|nr:malectin [Candidatus Aerophobetes bacterium]